MHACRICQNKETITFLSLGPTPLANSFLRPEQLSEAEPHFPLDVVFCNVCGLVQLDHVVPPEVMFKDYIYVSSTSDTMPAHFAAYAKEVVTRFIEAPSDMLLEIGSNDGCLLREFGNYRLRAVGMEPASNLAALANSAGIRTINDFFCGRSAQEMVEREGKAKVIIGNNVLAHIADLTGLVSALDTLLAPDGVAIFEVPYLIDLLDKDEFDTIYHEHLYYFAVRPLQQLFASRGMSIFDVKRVSVHGGSIRVYATRSGAAREIFPSVASLLRLEKTKQLGCLKTYQDLAQRVQIMKQNLTDLLRQLKVSGAKIAGYGAPAKGNTLLNYFQIGSDLLDFIVDKNPLKQGLRTPGMHIPVVPVERILRDQPDYLLLLAWNFADEIFQQQSEYASRGGQFIVPLPYPRVSSGNACAVGAVNADT